MMTPEPEPKFKIGDTVRGAAFTDSFGKFHASTAPLTVTKITLVAASFVHTPYPLPAYFRVQAEGTGNPCLLEGAERFFEFV
jgi:hypothetical protein